MTNFNQFSFDPRIQAGIAGIGFTDPTPIQQQAIPVVLQGDDVLGLAQTGTGKTAAFMLPILERLTRGPLRRVRALVLAPTRELAEQIHQATIDFSVNMKVRSVAIYGGVGKGPQIDALRRGVEIAIACPGRLIDLMGEGHIDLSHVEVFVLDEADRMCDMGFLPDVRRIVKQLPARRQSLFFSATMPRDARELANTILRSPVTVQIGRSAPVKTVSHALYPVHHRLKKKLLLDLLEQTATGRVLIFTRTKYRARNLARDLGRKGFRVAALQGNMSQNQRQRAMDGFRQGKFDLLVATDIAARGIDVTEITHVINFDMPDTVDAYTHRIGRTGRAQEKGEAFTFITPDDTPMVRSIEQLLGYRINRRELHGFDYGEFEVLNPAAQNDSNRSSRWATAPIGNRKQRQRRSNRDRRPNGKGNRHTPHG
jgi:ATP-dependent RNA helicase RhlE